jgi:dTDP-4-dehydrorhamnose reductase
VKILITGANGLLGQHLVQLLLQVTAYNILAIGKGVCRLPFNNERLLYADLDITDGVAAFSFYLQHKPDIIIHAAACTQVDICETNKPFCWDANVTATRFLLEAAKKWPCFLVYVSTDFIFDGVKGDYEESDMPEPVNYYGSSKLAAEKAVIESCINAAIVRTCLVYGNVLQGTRSNIIQWVSDTLQQQRTIKVVTDQYRTPTYVADLASGILLIVQQKAKGIYHIAGEEKMTPYDMAITTAKYLKLDESLIQKANASNFTQPAMRPAKTGLNIAKAKAALGYKPVSFIEGLKKMLG